MIVEFFKRANKEFPVEPNEYHFLAIEPDEETIQIGIASGGQYLNFAIGENELQDLDALFSDLHRLIDDNDD